MKITGFIIMAIGMILIAVCMSLFVNGCTPAIRFQWGDALYESTGDHILDELDVIKEKDADGTERIRIRVKKSDSKEVQAVHKALDLAGEAIKRVPITGP